MPKGLILSVGMSEEPETFAIKSIKPDWIAFVCTPDSRQKLDEIVKRTGLKPNQYQTFDVADDPSKIGNLVAQAHEAYRWVLDKVGPEGEIVVNPTAGRKWMSTGMTLFAGQTDAKIVYVDVDFHEGKPKPDTMRIVDLGNPDDAIGMLKAEEPVALFNRYDFEGAAASFAQLRPSFAAPQRLYAALKDVAGALAAWDRFEHYEKPECHEKLSRAAEEVCLAAQELRMSSVGDWGKSIKHLADKIKGVCESEKPSLEAVADLYFNAQRKLNTGRPEDAGARLYRALEGIAQWMLHKKGIKTAAVDWEDVPDDAKGRFKATRLDPARREYLPKKLGLNDSFALAKALGCEGAESFYDQNDFVLKNEIEIRNQSILAHGWTPAKKHAVKKFSEKFYERLSKLPVKLDQWDVPKLPRLWS